MLSRRVRHGRGLRRLRWQLELGADVAPRPPNPHHLSAYGDADPRHHDLGWRAQGHAVQGTDRVLVSPRLPQPSADYDRLARAIGDCALPRARRSSAVHRRFVASALPRTASVRGSRRWADRHRGDDRLPVRAWPATHDHAALADRTVAEHTSDGDRHEGPFMSPPVPSSRLSRRTFLAGTAGRLLTVALARQVTNLHTHGLHVSPADRRSGRRRVVRGADHPR